MLHIAAGMVVAYEQLKEGPIMEAFTKYNIYQALVSEEAGLKPTQKLGAIERERWEKETMLTVSSLKSARARVRALLVSAS